MTTRLSPTVRALVEAEAEIARLQKLLAAGVSERYSANVESVAKSCDLTKREAEVFALVIDGQRNIDIGRSLDVSRATAKWHMHNIFVKTGAADREGLVRLVTGLPACAGSPHLTAPAPAMPVRKGFAVQGVKGAWWVCPYTRRRGAKREYGKAVSGPFTVKGAAESSAVQHFQRSK